MISEDLIEKQYDLERDAIKQGKSRLHKQTYNVESKDYASASIYGVASIDCLLPRVVARINDTTDRIHARKNGVAFKEIAHYLADIDADACAAIALKLTFDKVFSFKEDASKVQNVCKSIGKAVEQECQMRFYETTAPGLLNTLKKNYWHKACGTQQKVTIMRTLMNRHDITWKRWDDVVCVKLGGWLLDCIMECSGWFEKRLERLGKKTHTHIVPSAAFMDVKDQVMASAELLAPMAWPMLIPPKPWSNDAAGGYLMNELMHGNDLVRRGNPSLIQGEKPLAFLNRIQSVAYTLNPFIVSVARTLQEKGIKVGKFIPVYETPIPPKPVDIAENDESRQAYKRAAAEAMNKNAAVFKESCRTRMTMELVQRFLNVDRFYLPWSFDYRGRAYAIPSFLTPQGCDFSKSLIRFADSCFVTVEAERWLKFQVATTYGNGLDKAPLSERHAWAVANEELITRVATDPIGNISEWEAAEEPWCFLAACEEYHAIMIAFSRTHTSLPIAVDATCSGLQILAGLALDKDTATLVNVVPGDKPQDAYKVAAAEATPNCPESIQPYMDRKTVKRVVMTVPYNAKPHSNRGYIREALKDKGVEIDKDDLTLTVSAVRAAMDVIVPGPMAVMKWIEAEVTEAIKGGKEHLQWVTPSGFVVHQKLMKQNKVRIELKLLGSVQKVTTAIGDSDKVDLRHHKNATAPNLIHSLDASLLHLSAIRFDAPLAVIHDSVLCRASDMDNLSSIVRKVYMHLFAENNYLKSWAEQIGATSEPPIIGTLKPEDVTNSTYFFC